MKIGIDEVGRGCLAGPLVIGAVALDKPIMGLKDSKLLSAKQRQGYADLIYQNASIAVLGWVWPHEIDDLGLTDATSLAISRALNLVTAKIDSIILDGKVNYLPANRLVKTVIGADNLIPCVSAASIIAKVARDSYMHNFDRYFPNYGFIKHVGYGTKQHLSALTLHGPCVLHRLSFSPVAKELSYGL